MTLEETAKRIDKLMYDFNPYEYKDYFENPGDGEPQIIELLLLDRNTVIEKLQEIAESDDEESAQEAKNILEELSK